MIKLGFPVFNACLDLEFDPVFPTIKNKHWDFMCPVKINLISLYYQNVFWHLSSVLGCTQFHINKHKYKNTKHITPKPYYKCYISHQTFLTWREPLSHWESPPQYLGTGYYQYPNHLRRSIQNVSRQSRDHRAPDGTRNTDHSSFIQTVTLVSFIISSFSLLLNCCMKLTWAGFVSIPASEPL